MEELPHVGPESHQGFTSSNSYDMVRQYLLCFYFFPHQAFDFTECQTLEAKRRTVITTASASLMGISALLGIVFIPILIKALTGVRRIYLVIQQICIICYLMLEGISVFAINYDLDDVIIQSMLNERDRERDAYTYYNILTYEEIFRYFSEIFYLEYYFISWMYTYDVYVMICEPFLYANFSNKKNVAKRLLVGSFLCIVVTGDILVKIFIGLKLSEYENDYANSKSLVLVKELEELQRKRKAAKVGTSIFHLIKATAFKITYGLAIIKSYFMINKSLKESITLSSNHGKDMKSHRNLVHFILIPFFLNLLFLGHDVPKELFPFLKRNTCDVNYWILELVSPCIFTAGSFSYYAGYLIFFPKIRAAVLTCGKVSDSNS